MTLAGPGSGGGALELADLALLSGAVAGSSRPGGRRGLGGGIPHEDDPCGLIGLAGGSSQVLSRKGIGEYGLQASAVPGDRRRRGGKTPGSKIRKPDSGLARVILSVRAQPGLVRQTRPGPSGGPGGEPFRRIEFLRRTRLPDLSAGGTRSPVPRWSTAHGRRCLRSKTVLGQACIPASPAARKTEQSSGRKCPSGPAPRGVPAHARELFPEEPVSHA